MGRDTEIREKVISHASSFALSPNSGYVVQFVHPNTFGNSYIRKTLAKIGKYAQEEEKTIEDKSKYIENIRKIWDENAKRYDEWYETFEGAVEHYVAGSC